MDFNVHTHAMTQSGDATCTGIAPCLQEPTQLEKFDKYLIGGSSLLWRRCTVVCYTVLDPTCLLPCQLCRIPPSAPRFSIK